MNRKNSINIALSCSRSVVLLWIALFGMSMFGTPAFAQHVHQLIGSNGTWTDLDLTTIVSGPAPAFYGLTAFYTTSDNDLHVFYISSPDQHIHQLSNTYYRFLHRWQWSDEDETIKTGGVSATSGGFSPISGFAVGQAQYVYFCGNDGAIHEYSFGDGGIWTWTDKNLNVLIGGGAPACSTSSNSLLAFPVPQITQRDVFYQPASSPSDLYHFVLNDTNRYLEDVTAIANGSQGDGTWMSGFANGNDLDVFLAASDGSIHEYRGLAQKKVWRDYNLTNLSQGVPSATYLHNGVSALLPDAAQVLVYYAPSAFDVHQIAFQNSVWTDVDMGGPGPNYEAQLIASSAPNYQWNLFFSCDQGGVFGLCDRFDNGVWGSQQLYSFGAGLEGGMAGFSLGTNTQYLYYITFD